MADEMNAAMTMPLAHDPELVSDFILESREHLERIEASLLELERDAGNAEAVHAAFRGFHTIKGLAGFLEFAAIQELAHEVETILDLVRNGQAPITSGTIDVVLESTDQLRKWVRLLEGSLGSGSLAECVSNPALLDSVRGLIRADQGREATVEVEHLAALSQAMIVGDQPAESAEESAPAAPSGAESSPAEAQKHSKSSELRSVKVDTGKLDHLVDMVGEMVIAQSLIRHDPDVAALNFPRLTRNMAQLARITDDVQKTAMAMRMVPIGQLFQKMARVVRDLARKTGKEAELELYGEDTELDRNIVEELADPLMHMLRNSLDHGVEPPEERTARGKPRVAKVRLRASHQAGHILIEVGDDGAGLDRDRILAKARSKGLVGADANPSDQEVYSMIFQPGFSTAAQVTDVSGRGVGMDVVRKQVQKLRGRIEIDSRPGLGATFLLKLPLTLAIIDGLVVGVGGERYIVPLFAVREMLRPASESVFTVQGRAEMAMVRGRLLPVVRLHRVFGVVPKHESPTESLLLVAESDERVFCVLVDELIGKQEVVIKSLGALFEGVRGVAGGAILGDGRVGLILDLDGVFGASEVA